MQPEPVLVAKSLWVSLTVICSCGQRAPVPTLPLASGAAALTQPVADAKSVRALAGMVPVSTSVM